MIPEKLKNFIFLVERMRAQQNRFFNTRLAFRDGYHKEVDARLEQKVDALLSELINDVANG